MFSWLTWLFGTSPQKESSRTNVRERVHEVEASIPPASPVPEGQPPLSAEAAGFMLSLMSPEDQPINLSDLPHHDREFVASNLRRLIRKEFEIPLLPGATIRIQQLLANPDASVSELAGIFKNDSSLSAELLRLANSSYLVYRYPTLDLQQAIIRVGFGQLNGLVVMFSLRSRILHNRRYQHEVTWVTDLSLAMAKTCQMLAKDLNMPPEEAFTLGLMHHIEYLVILGEAAKNTVAHRGEAISRSAIAESIRRVGMQMHSLIAQSWGISSFEKYYHAATGDAESDSTVSDVPRRLDQLQRILIEVMAGRNPEIEVDGFDSLRLKKCVESVVVKPLTE
jgi:hypothetical protein